MLNKFYVDGRLVCDVLLKKTQRGQDMAIFKIANEVQFNGKKKVNYISVFFWGSAALKLKQTATKGTSIIVEGQLGITQNKAADGTYRDNCQLIGQSYTLVETKQGHQQPPVNPVEASLSDPTINFD